MCRIVHIYTFISPWAYMCTYSLYKLACVRDMYRLCVVKCAFELSDFWLYVFLPVRCSRRCKNNTTKMLSSSGNNRNKYFGTSAENSLVNYEMDHGCLIMLNDSWMREINFWTNIALSSSHSPISIPYNEKWTHSLLFYCIRCQVYITAHATLLEAPCDGDNTIARY